MSNNRFNSEPITMWQALVAVMILGVAIIVVGNLGDWGGTRIAVIIAVITVVIFGARRARAGH